MRVKIDKSRRDNQSRRIQHFRALRRRYLSRRPKLFELLSIQLHVERPIRLRRRVDHPPILNQKH